MTCRTASIAWGIAVLATAGLAQEQKAPVFGTGVEAVYLDVFVGQDGQPLTGLTASDFEVEDGGVRQSVELVSAQQVPLQAILLLDVSGGIAGRKLDQLKAAGSAVLDALGPNDSAELITFSHDLRRAEGGSPAELREALAQVRAGGATALYDATYAALALAEGRDRRPVVLLFSDGEDTQSLLGSDAVYETARMTEATVYAVRTEDETAGRSVAGVAARDVARPDQGGQRAPTLAGTQDAFGLGGKGPSLRVMDSPDVYNKGLAFAPTREDAPRFLDKLAEQTGGRVFGVSAPDLTRAFRQVLDDARTRYLLRYEPSGVAGPGWHEIEVSVRGRKTEVRTRKGYFRPS